MNITKKQREQLQQIADEFKKHPSEFLKKDTVEDLLLIYQHNKQNGRDDTLDEFISLCQKNIERLISWGF